MSEYVTVSWSSGCCLPPTEAVSVETIPVAPPPVTTGSCVNADRLEVALAIANGAESRTAEWVASPPNEATSW